MNVNDLASSFPQRERGNHLFARNSSSPFAGRAKHENHRCLTSPGKSNLVSASSLSNLRLPFPDDDDAREGQNEPTRQRSVSFSFEEVYEIPKITNPKEKRAYWLTTADLANSKKAAYQLKYTNSTEASLLTEKLDVLTDDETLTTTRRGLECCHTRDKEVIQAAKEYASDPVVYGYISARAVTKAQRLAKQDALDAAAYQMEEESETSSRSSHATRRSSRRRLLRQGGSSARSLWPISPKR